MCIKVLVSHTREMGPSAGVLRWPCTPIKISIKNTQAWITEQLNNESDTANYNCFIISITFLTTPEIDFFNNNLINFIS